MSDTKSPYTENNYFNQEWISGTLSDIPDRSIYIDEIKNPTDKNEITYAVDMGDWVQNSANGLKGVAAKWAKEVLENNKPKNLIRVKNTKENLDKYLPECNKIIYAVGYEINNLPDINVEIIPDSETGIIGPNLFGIGIAFPGSSITPDGKIEHGIGLNSFMKYAQKVIVNWIKKDNYSIFKLRIKRKKYQKFEELFNIEIL